MLTDMPLEEPEAYRPSREEPGDFDAFWQQTLAEARRHPLAARFQSADFGLQTVASFDVTFAGSGGQPVRAWLLLPAWRDEVCPPSTVFAAYNHYAGAKAMRVWPYNGHEGGESFQQLEQVRTPRERWL